MRALWLLFAVAYGLAACSFDFESFAIDDGGASDNAARTTDDARPDTAAVQRTETDGQTTTDASIEDAALDVALFDTTVVTDTSLADMSVTDTSVADTAVTDTSVVDTSLADTSLPDATTIEDTGVDSAPCTPSTACLTTAVNCANNCKVTSAQCVAACNPKKCKDECRVVAAQCHAGCTSTCIACTQADGCPAPVQCGTASK